MIGKESDNCELKFLATLILKMAIDCMFDYFKDACLLHVYR